MKGICRAFGLLAIEAPAERLETEVERKRRVRLATDPRAGTRCWNCNVTWPDHSGTCAAR